MAVSQSFPTSNSRIFFRIVMTPGTPNIEGNYTPVNVKVQAWRTNDFDTYGSGTCYCTINGVPYSQPIVSSQHIKLNSYTVLFDINVNIPHNSDGTKILNIQAQISHSQFNSSAYSENFALATIPRYAKITSFTVDSITGTQFRFNFTTDKTVDAVQYSQSGGAWLAQPVGNIITGLAPGHYYTIKIRVRNKDSGLWTESSVIGVTTVALSSVSSSADFNLESSLPITISRANANMVHDIYLEAYYDGAWRDVAKNALTNITTGATLTPTAGAVTTLQNKHPNTKSVQVRLRIICRWGVGGAVQGTVYKTGTATIVNADPSIDSVSYADINATVQAILGNDQKILRNKSTLRVTAGLAKSQKGATLKSYKVTIGGNEYNVNTIGTEETGKAINVGAVNQAVNQAAVISVTDSRGNTASRSFAVQMIDYIAPQFLQASADRLNNYEERSYIDIEGRRSIIKPGDADVNEIYLRYRIKQNPSGEYGSYVNVTKNNTGISGAYQNFDANQYMADYPNNQSYTVELGISDKFTDWDTILITLTEGIALLRFLKDRVEAGVNFDMLGNLDVGGGIKKSGIEVSLNGHEHPYLPLAGGDLSGILKILGNVAWHDGNCTSGSNSNGYYLKLADGTMICYGRYIESVATTANGTTHTRVSTTHTFPVAFKDTPSITISGHASEFIGASARTVMLTSFALMYHFNMALSMNMVFTWNAIGRWK